MNLEPQKFSLPAGKATITAPGRDPLVIDYPQGFEVVVAPDVRSLGTGDFENAAMVPVLEKLLADLRLGVKLIHRGDKRWEVFTLAADAATVQAVLAGVGQLVALSRQAVAP